MTTLDLGRLTNKACLEQVHIGTQFLDMYDGKSTGTRFDFMVYSYIECPNLWETATILGKLAPEWREGFARFVA